MVSQPRSPRAFTFDVFISQTSERIEEEIRRIAESDQLSYALLGKYITLEGEKFWRIVYRFKFQIAKKTVKLWFPAYFGCEVISLRGKVEKRQLIQTIKETSVSYAEFIDGIEQYPYRLF